MNFILYGSFYGERYVVYYMASLESLFGLNCPFTYLSLFTIEKLQDWIFLLIIISNFSDKMTYLLWQNDKYEFIVSV